MNVEKNLEISGSADKAAQLPTRCNYSYATLQPARAIANRNTVPRSSLSWRRREPLRRSSVRSSLCLVLSGRPPRLPCTKPRGEVFYIRSETLTFVKSRKMQYRGDQQHSSRPEYNVNRKMPPRMRTDRTLYSSRAAALSHRKRLLETTELAKQALPDE